MSNNQLGVPGDSEIAILRTICAYCRNSGTLMCQRCRETYCSSKCQNDDWYEHKRICFPMPVLIPVLSMQSISKVEEPKRMESPANRAQVIKAIFPKNSAENDYKEPLKPLRRPHQASLVTPMKTMKINVPTNDTLTNTVAHSEKDAMQKFLFSNPAEKALRYPALRNNKVPTKAELENIVYVVKNEQYLPPPSPPPDSLMVNDAKQDQYDGQQNSLAPNNIVEDEQATVNGSDISAQVVIDRGPTDVIYTLADIKTIPIPQKQKVKLYLLDMCDIDQGYIIAGVYDLEHIRVLEQDLLPKIEKYITNLSCTSYSPQPGELCVTIFEADENWYRAVCLEHNADDDTFTLMFIDYCNVTTTTKEYIRPISEQFLHPTLANTCYIEGLNVDISASQVKQYLEDYPVFEIDHAVALLDEYNIKMSFAA